MASVDQFNQWFMTYAPKAYRDTRSKTVDSVEQTLIATAELKATPAILQTLRMCTCPPLARDRLIGLANANKNLVEKMEEGSLPKRINEALLEENLARLVGILARLLDMEIFPRLAASRRPTKQERYRSSTIIADRLCGAIADPIVRNAQEERQLSLIGKYLTDRNYKRIGLSTGQPLNHMEPGTFTFRHNVKVTNSQTNGKTVNIPIDAIIQPANANLPNMPILIEAKSAGDYTNVNKRRKEEGKKMYQLKAEYGADIVFILFLCGYFDGGYLGYSAQDGFDWIWEHRMQDLDQLGL